MKDANEREATLNTATEMLGFIFGALADQEMTTRQRTLFEYLSEFLITAVPNATINDFRAMLDPEDHAEYDEHKANAAPEVVDYLNTDFVKDRLTIESKGQVLSRLWPMLRRTAFATMFGAPQSKLDLFKEANTGKLILIKPDKHFLGDQGTKLFGRFWIAQVALMAQKRAAPGAKKLPTYFYIDEAQDYLRGGDPKIEAILEQARKQNVGLTLLHHTATQLKSDDLVKLLGANTSTKMCGSLDTSDEARFAAYLNCDTQFIKAQPKGSFATFVRGVTTTAMSLAVPFVDLAKEPQMNAAAYEAYRKQNRAQYGAPTERHPTPHQEQPATTDRTRNTAERAGTPTQPASPSDPLAPDTDY